MRKSIVLLLEFFILITLLGVQIIEPGLVSEVNVVDLLLVRVELILHVTLLGEKGVQVRPLLIVLVLDMHVESFNVFGLGIAAVLVESQVVVGKVALELTHVLDQHLILAL